MIAITFALPAESSELFRKIGSQQSQRTGGGVVTSLKGRPIAICHTGVGREHCRRALHNFLGTIQPQLLISSGFAGSVSAHLNVGDLFLGRNYSGPDLTRIIEGASLRQP